MNVSEAVRQRISDLCREKKLTVNRLSTTAGVTQSTVKDIVKGITYNPGIATIKKICDGFDISLREFFDSELFDASLEQEVK